MRHRWARWALILAGWTLLGLFFTAQIYLIYARSRQSVPWARVLPGGLTFWYAWALIAPIVLRLGRRFPLARRRWTASLAVHLPASLLFAFVHEALYSGLFCLVDMYGGKPCDFKANLFGTLFTFIFTLKVVIYWVILFASQALEYSRRFREEELRASQLESELAQAQLQSLMMQLHPHFLFNTLHTISALIHKAPADADEMIARLSDLLRHTLNNIGVQQVSLQQELELLRNYLEIERIRFQDRLAVEISVEPETLDAQVPNLILQPLVENAIRHGIASRTEPGLIEIRASREDGMLRLEVRDNGPGINSLGESTFVEGVGLANTRARIKHLYGAAHHFELRNARGGGLVVNLKIPYRASEA